MFHKGEGLRPVTRANKFRQRQIYQLSQEVCDVAHLLLFDVQTLNDVVRRRPARAILIDDCVSHVLLNRLGGNVPNYRQVKRQEQGYLIRRPRDVSLVDDET